MESGSSNARRFQDALAKAQSKEQAIENIKEAIKLYLEVHGAG